jgi:hypothetical protein
LPFPAEAGDDPGESLDYPDVSLADGPGGPLADGSDAAPAGGELPFPEEAGVDPGESLWATVPPPAGDGDASAPAGARPDDPEGPGGDAAPVAAASDFLESNTSYVGADTSSLVDVGGPRGGGGETPPFERRPTGSTLETPYSAGPAAQKSLPETSTAVIVNYLDDRDDVMLASDIGGPELGDEEDMDIDMLEIPAPAPFLARPMTPVPREPR